jgi:hypothetical protein
MSPSWESILGTVGPERRVILEHLKSGLEQMSPSMCREFVIAAIDDLPAPAREAMHWKAVRKMAGDETVSIEDLHKAHVIAFKRPLNQPIKENTHV